MTKIDMLTPQKKKALIALKKAQTHLNNVVDMTEKNIYCMRIMQQNLAVIGLLRAAHQLLMENHLQTCFKKAMASKNKKLKQKMTTEILGVTKLYNR